jgi:hypothetical protein
MVAKKLMKSSPESSGNPRDAGRLLGFGEIPRDITEPDDIETVCEQPRQAQETETVGQVTGSIAHDLNNILGVIIGNLGLLQELCGDRPDIGEFARDAMTAALQGSSLTQRLFAFAQRQKLLDAPARTSRS